LAQKIKYILNFAAIFKISAKIIISKCWQNENTREHSTVYVISQLIFLRGREIAQAGGKILPKVLPKFQAKF